jgi:hypothetical protein
MDQGLAVSRVHAWLAVDCEVHMINLFLSW